jgi:hypothetical protein
MKQQGRFYAALHHSGVGRNSPAANRADRAIVTKQPIRHGSGVDPGDASDTMNGDIAKKSV